MRRPLPSTEFGWRSGEASLARRLLRYCGDEELAPFWVRTPIAFLIELLVAEATSDLYVAALVEIALLRR